jgi:hypothetical protein
MPCRYAYTTKNNKKISFLYNEIYRQVGAENFLPLLFLNL